MSSNFVFLLLLMAPLIGAAKPAVVKDQGVNMTMKTTYGDRLVRIRVQGTTQKSAIELISNAGITKKRDLKAKELKFILAEFAKLPVPKSIPNSCYRSRIDIEMAKPGAKIQKKSSCIGQMTITEPKYSRFARILASAF